MLIAEFEGPSFGGIMLTIAIMMLVAKYTLAKIDPEGKINEAAKEKAKASILKRLQ